MEDERMNWGRREYHLKAAELNESDTKGDAHLTATVSSRQTRFFSFFFFFLSWGSFDVERQTAHC